MNKYAAKRVFGSEYSLMLALEQDRAAHPDALDLSGHTVDPCVFPVAALKAASRRMLAVMGKEALQYSSSDDYMPLKAQIAARYGRFGLNVKDANFIVTNGSTQALDVIFKSFVDEGDVVFVTTPTEPRVLQVMAMYQVEIVAMPMNGDEPDMAATARLFAEKHPRILYGMPDFGGVNGGRWSLETRKAMGELVQQAGGDCLFIEHDFYGELSRDGQRLPFVKQFAGDNAVLVGSFSEVLGPGLRCGWICATDPADARTLTGTKQKTDSHMNGYMQRVLWQYHHDNDFNAHIEAIRAVYNAKRETLCAALKAALPADVTISAPEGGVNIWLTLPSRRADMAVYRAALAAGLILSPAEAFYQNAPAANALRLCFAGIPDDALTTVAARLAELLK